MHFIKARIIGTLLLLMLNELGIRANGAEISDYFMGRSTQPTTTICVEIKPSGPLEQPYYMCRGGEFPAFPKIPPNSMMRPQYTNMATNDQAENTQMQLTNVNKDHYETSYNNKHNKNKNNHKNKYRVDSESATDFQEYSNTSGGNKHSNDFITVESRSSNGPTVASGNNNGVQARIKESYDNLGSMDHFQKQSPYQKHAEHHQQLQYGQDVQPESQPQLQLQKDPQRQQPIQFHLQQQQQNLSPSQKQQMQVDEFHQPSNSFGSHPKNENTAPGEKLREYDSMFSPDAMERTAPHHPFFPSHVIKSTDSHPTDSLQKNPTSHSHSNKSFKMSQQDNSECEGDCRQTMNPPITSESYNGRYNGKQNLRSEASSSIFQPNPHTVPIANDGNILLNKNVNFATSHAAQNHASSIPAYQSVATNERQMMPFTIAAGAHRSNPLLHSSNNQELRHQSAVNQRAPQKVLSTLPAQHRYRDIIDKEVLQVPDWSVTQDELNFYRSRIEPEMKNDPNILKSHPTPRTIPLEHMDDPVMRAFYNSLPDVSPAYTMPYKPQHPQRQIQAPYMPPASIQQLPPPPPPTPTPSVCSPCPASPQQYNYNPCPPSSGYSLHPFFVALPCYNPPVYQAMMPQLQINYPPNTPFQNVGSKPVGMANPFVGESPQMTSTPATVTHTEASSTNKTNMTSATLAIPAANDSNESAENLEEIDNSKGLAVLKTNDPTVSAPKENSPQQSESVASGKSNGFNGSQNSNHTEETRQSVTTTSTTTKTEIASYPLTTPSSSDPVAQAEPRTTFRSLFLNARKLAQMVENDYDPYASDTSTPTTSPKKQRQTSKTTPNERKGKISLQ